VTNNRPPLAILRSLGSAAGPATEVLEKHFDDPNSWGRLDAAEVLVRANPARAAEAIRLLLGVLTAPATQDRAHLSPAYAAVGRLDASARPAAKLLAEALAAHPDDELTVVLARALRRADPALARAAGVR
jgi:hypothetical protein